MCENVYTSYFTLMFQSLLESIKLMRRTQLCMKILYPSSQRASKENEKSYFAFIFLARIVYFYSISKSGTHRQPESTNQEWYIEQQATQPRDKNLPSMHFSPVSRAFLSSFLEFHEAKKSDSLIEISVAPREKKKKRRLLCNGVRRHRSHIVPYRRRER